MRIPFVGKLRSALRKIEGHLEFLVFIKRLGLFQSRPGRDFRDWSTRNFGVPAPQFVKWKVLRNWGGANVWVETGTYFGETTSFLSSFSKRVISIEPGPELAKRAKELFKTSKSIEILEGTSEEILPGLITRFTQEEVADISFWLDGHFSAGVTFQGVSDTPIREELMEISKHVKNFGLITVFVDDFRCFRPSAEEYLSYPPKSFLTDWAEQNNLGWTVEHDIFIATNRMEKFSY